MTATVILIILAALAVGVLSGAGKARMNNAVFDVAALISAAQMRAVGTGIPHFIIIHRPPVRNAADSYLRVQMLERPEDGPGIASPDWNNLNLINGPAVALASQPAGAAAPIPAIPRGSVGLAISSGPEQREVSFLDLDSNRVRSLVRPPFNTIALTTLNNANPLNLPSPDLLTGCNFCVNPAGDEPYGVLRFNPDGTMRVMSGPVGGVDTGAAIAFAPNTDDEQTVTPRLLIVSAPAGATIVY